MKTKTKEEMELEEAIQRLCRYSGKQRNDVKAQTVLAEENGKTKEEITKTINGVVDEWENDTKGDTKGTRIQGRF